MVLLAYQWKHWFTNGTIVRAYGAIGITIGTNGFTNGAIDITIGTNGLNNGSIGRTLNTRLFLACPRYYLVKTIRLFVLFNTRIVPRIKCHSPVFLKRVPGDPSEPLD